MEKILIQLERLERHYNHSVKTYDYTSMLDLAHILRIWTELKVPLLTKYDNMSKTVFKTASPSRKILNHIKKSQYVLCYFSKDGVITYANKGQLADIDHDAHNEGTLSVKFKYMGNESSVLTHFGFVSKSLEEEYMHAMKNENVTKCNYTNWLSSEIVRLQYTNDSGKLAFFSISREMLIKRVANVYDASHTSLNDEGGENKFDAPIKWLMNFKVGGLPLPYFLLLKVAQDILKNIPILLNISPSQDTHPSFHP